MLLGVEWEAVLKDACTPACCCCCSCRGCSASAADVWCRASIPLPRSLGGGCWVEAPTLLTAAWEEPGGAEFEYVRFTLTTLEAA